MTKHLYPNQEAGVEQSGTAFLWHDTGLFLVVRGSPQRDGLIASRDAIRSIASELGETLDLRIRNYAKAHRGDAESFIHRLTRQVAIQMIATLEQARTRVRALHQLGVVEEIPAICVAKLVGVSLKGEWNQRLFFLQEGGGQFLLQQGQRITQVYTPGVHFVDLKKGDRFVLLDRRLGEGVDRQIPSILLSSQEDSCVRDELICKLQRERSPLADRPAYVLVHTF